jgi:hypothetical protein
MRFFGTVPAVFLIAPLSASAGTGFNIDLGTAGAFAVLGGSSVTNTGQTTVNGDLGLYPDTTLTGITGFSGFPMGTVNGTISDGDATANQAQADALAAYTFAASTVDEPAGVNLTGTDLGGLILTPGVYYFSSSAQLTGNLVLNAQGDPNAVFVFQIGSTLTTANAASVTLINGADGANVFWQVGSSATLGIGTAFTGTILADQSITLTTDADIEDGRAIALNGAVTMDTNDVSNDGSTSMVPEPSTAAFLLVIGLPGFLWLRKLKGRRTANLKSMSKTP